MPQMFDDVGEIVEETLRRVGKRVVLALPLGIGKPNLIANEFFRRARGDASLDLTIFTALSLRKPTGSSPLEKAFIDPLVARVFGNYPELDYLSAVRRDEVPANVRVIEFFFEPGSLLNSAHAQSHYLTANYTHVARELLARGVNVIAHVVAKRVVGGTTEISLGSNPDVTVDLLPEVAKLRAAGTPVVMLGQVHREMPFMLGAAALSADHFDLLLDHSRYDYDLFAPPNPSLSTVDHAIGLHASAWCAMAARCRSASASSATPSCIRCCCVTSRTRPGAARSPTPEPSAARRWSTASVAARRSPPACSAPPRCSSTRCSICTAPASCAAASTTIYRCSARSRPMARSRVSMKRCSRRCSTRARGRGSRPPTWRRSRQPASCAARRVSTMAASSRPTARASRRTSATPGCAPRWRGSALALKLQGGTVMHAGFLLGPRSFYAALRELPEYERRLFDMRGVGYINQLYGPGRN